MSNIVIGEEQKELKEKFLRFPIIKDGRINLRQRFILAALIYRSRVGQGASCSRLAKMLGWDRQTISRQLKKFPPGYIINEDGQHRILNPLNGLCQHRYTWKKRMNPDKDWFNNIRTFRFQVPCPWKIGQIIATVLFRALEVLRPEQNIKGLAKMIGVSRTSVYKAIEYLSKEKRLTYQRLLTINLRAKITYKFSIPKKPDKPQSKLTSQKYEDNTKAVDRGLPDFNKMTPDEKARYLERLARDC